MLDANWQLHFAETVDNYKNSTSNSPQNVRSQHPMNIYADILLWFSMDTPHNHCLPPSPKPTNQDGQAEEPATHAPIDFDPMQGNDGRQVGNSRTHEFPQHDGAAENFHPRNDIFLGEHSVGSQFLRSL